MMDFADDFTYFTLEEVLAEVRKLYSHNKHVVDIRLDKAANDDPTLNFYVNKPQRLGLHQLGLPGQFRCLKTRFIAANNA
ncbi:MAG: hypothetical protein PVG20_09590 [Thioalkalispiraceae bacterium]|jgi:hypothetical protein